MKRPMAACLTSLLFLSCAPGEHPRVPAPPPALAAGARIPVTPVAAADSTADSAVPPLDGTSIPVAPPFQETVYLSDSLHAAVSYSLRLDPGELLEVAIAAEGAAPPPLLDVFQGTTSGARALAHMRGSTGSFQFEAPAAGEYTLRLRTAPGPGGHYHLVLGTAGELPFPVAGGSHEWVRGRFGDPRDGGSRDHDGLDIFAPRGTPVIAVEDVVIARVESSASGGRVIWCEDERRGLTYFYAHLEQQLVTPGMRVSAGDTIGTVGNSGNARGSSPHLHFAAYRPGLVPVDPTPLLGAGPAHPPELAPDSALAGLGSLARTRARAVRLRASPERTSPVVAELGEGTVVRVLGAVAEWRHVRLGGGGAGFIANWLLEPLAGTH